MPLLCRSLKTIQCNMFCVVRSGVPLRRFPKRGSIEISNCNYNLAVKEAELTHRIKTWGSFIIDASRIEAAATLNCTQLLINIVIATLLYEASLQFCLGHQTLVYSCKKVPIQIYYLFIYLLQAFIMCPKAVNLRRDICSLGAETESCKGQSKTVGLGKWFKF